MAGCFAHQKSDAPFRAPLKELTVGQSHLGHKVRETKTHAVKKSANNVFGDEENDNDNNNNNNNDNNNNEILIKREPLVYTKVRRAVQKKKNIYHLG